MFYRPFLSLFYLVVVVRVIPGGGCLGWTYLVVVVRVVPDGGCHDLTYLVVVVSGGKFLLCLSGVVATTKRL